MKIFFHSHEQTQALLGLTRDTAQKIIGANFTNPAEDQATIRYLAYQKGKLELLQSLLADDFEVEQPQPKPQE